MFIYIVYKETTDDNYVVSTHRKLDNANDYAKREISDTWRVQDGFQYVANTRDNGTKSYSLEPYYTYYVEQIELKD